MKNFIIFILIFLPILMFGQNPRVFTVKCNISQTGGGAGYWTVNATNINDPLGLYDATEITVGDSLQFNDGGIQYSLGVTLVVSAVGNQSTFRVSSAGITGISSVPTTSALISRGTPIYGFVPWTANISDADNQANSENTMRLIEVAVNRAYQNAAEVPLSDPIDFGGVEADTVQEALEVIDARLDTAHTRLLPSGTSGYTLRYDGSSWVSNSNIFNNGTNVGVGSINPLSKLHIAGIGSGNYVTIASNAASLGNYAGLTLSSVIQSGAIRYASEIRNINTQSSPLALNPRLGFFLQNTGTYLPADRVEKFSILTGGEVGIGDTIPDAFLKIRAGTTSRAPLKFTTTSAALLSTPEAGAIEVLGDDIYYTPVSAIRKKLAYGDDGTYTPTVTKNTSTDTIVTVYTAFYVQNDSVASISGQILLNTEAATVTSSLQLSLPPGITTNFTDANNDVSGIVTTRTNVPVPTTTAAWATTDTSTEKIVLNWVADSGTGVQQYLSFNLKFIVR